MLRNKMINSRIIMVLVILLIVSSFAYSAEFISRSNIKSLKDTTEFKIEEFTDERDKKMYTFENKKPEGTYDVITSTENYDDKGGIKLNSLVTATLNGDMAAPYLLLNDNVKSTASISIEEAYVVKNQAQKQK